MPLYKAWRCHHINGTKHIGVFKPHQQKQKTAQKKKMTFKKGTVPVAE
jgi:hypothetical protein